MYEMYGEQFTMEELQNIASERNITLEELFSNNPELKEIKTEEPVEQVEEVKIEPQETGAPVAEVAAPDMDSKQEPGLLESLSARTARGFVSFGKGIENLKNSLLVAGMELVDGKMSKQDRENYKEALDNFYIPGSIAPRTADYEKAEKLLSEHVRSTENESIREAILAGDIGEAAEMTVGGMLESLPSIVAAGTGVGGIVALGASSAGNKFDEELREDPEQTTGRLLANALTTGTAEAFTEIATRGILKSAGLIKTNTGKEAAQQYIDKTMKSLAKKIGVSSLEEAGSEALTEAIVMMSDAVILDKEIKTKDIYNRLVDAAVIGGFTGGTIQSIGQIATPKDAMRSVAENILTPAPIKKEIQDYSDLISALEADLSMVDPESQEADVIAQSIRQQEKNIYDKKRYVRKTLENMTPEQIKSYASNLDQIKKMEGVLKNNPSNISKELFGKKIEKLSEENKFIFMEPAKKVEMSTEFSAPIAKALGVEQQVFETTEEFKEVLPEADKDKASIAGGFYDPRTKTIYINKEAAANTLQINVGAHEVLHPILNSQIGDAAKQGEFVSDIKKLLNKRQRDKMEELMEGYKKRGEYDTEYLTVLSDNLVKNNLEYDDTLVEKIVKLIKNTVNKFRPQEVDFEIGFDNAQQVFNFIKEYSDSAKKGKLSESAKKVIDFSKEDAITKAQFSYEENVQKLEERYFSGEIDSDQYYSELDKLEEGQEITPVERETKTAPSRDFKATLDAAGSNPEGFDPFDLRISQTVESMVKAKARKFLTQDKRVVDLTNLPGFNIDDFASEVYFNMMKGKKLKEGGFGPGYIQVFDPSVNDSLYGYINAQLGNRMRAVLGEGDIAEETYSVQADEQVGLSDFYDFTEDIDRELYTEEDIDEGLINPISLLDEANQTKAINEANEKINNINLDNLIFKKTPNLVTGTLSEFFDVRESVIQKASQNLNTTELENTAPKIAEISKLLMSIMPQGAIVGKEGELAVSEKLIGTGTGLPRKILEAFYTKNRRLVSAQEGIGRKGAGLEPFVLRDDITEKDFLNALGINEDGTHNPEIKPKSPQSQTRRAMLDMFGKLVSNVAIRQHMKDNNFSVVAVNDLAAGKSPNMFSFSFKEQEKILDKEIPFSEFSEEFKDEFKRLYPYVDVDQDTEAKLYQMILQLMEESSTTARMRQLFYNDPIIKEKLEELGVEAKDILDIHDKTGVRRNELTLDGVRITAKHGQEMASRFPKFKGITPARIRGLFAFDQRAYIFQDDKRNKVAEGIHPSTKIVDGSIEDKLEVMMTSSEAESLVKKGKKIKFNAKQKRYIDNINNILSEKKIDTKYFYTSRLSSSINDLYKRPKKSSNPEFEFYTEQQKIDYVKQEVDKAKEYNTLKENLIKLELSLLNSYVTEKGISKQERAERIVYAVRLLSDTSGGLKDLASITYRGSVIGPNTEAVRIEHLISTGFQDVTFLKSVITGKMPNSSYKSGIVDDGISNTMDSKKIRVLLKGGKYKDINYQTGAIKSRYQEIVLRAKDQGAIMFSIDEDVDVKSKESFLDLSMGNILKVLTGLPVNEQVSQSTAKIMAANRNKKWRLLSPSADDFVGLLYSTLGKGKIGDAQLKFYKKYLIDPFNRANHAMDAARQKISRDFKDLNKEYEVVKKSLNKKSGYKNYTNDQAIRVYLYKKAGASNATLSINEADEKALLSIVKGNPEFEAYANYLMEITELDNSWIEPSPNWVVGSIFDDVNSIIDRLKRAEYLSEWKENVDIIFSDNNRNKLEGYFGEDYRKALDDMLYRMEKGKAIPEKMNKEMNRFQQWLTGSVAVTMFLNRRSAVLQTISNINYMNWSDNNPIAAAKAFANTPQFAKDFALIFNSDYLKQRRGGLKTEVEAAVLANELRKGGVEGMRGAINKILKAGFTLTQLGDSFAISFGGASFYRNRKNSYLKQGLTEQEAREQAFLDFREISEESQQSARPDRLSMQQTNSIGRVFLAFQNTPMQYYRLIAKAIMDIKNGRGDLKTNMSKIAYYGVAQNLAFTAMQQALFAFLFDAPDEEEEEETKDEKVLRTINNSIDTLIRGTGYYGAIVSTVKNVILEFIKQEKKGFKADHAYTMVQALNLSAPIGIKARTLYQGAYQNYKYNKEIIDDIGYDIDNPGYDIVSSLISFGVNVPLDKVIQMTRGIKEASDKDNEAWQRIALALGWSTWNLGMPNEKIEKAKKINTERKRRKSSGKSFGKTFGKKLGE